MGKAAVQINNLIYTYPDGSKALDDVSLTIMKGERVAIVGPNGAGKSTLFMLISGLFKPTSGSINVLGTSAKGNLVKLRTSVGLIFQDPDDQLFSPTLLEDVIFGPLNMGLPEEEVHRRAEEALKNVGLEAYKEKPPHHLSLGEKKKAAIAVVLAMKPEILILDEPTANLDPTSRSELLNLINRFNKDDGITLVTATHDVNIVPMIADRVYVLNKGRVAADGSVREIFSNSKIMKEAKLEPPTVTHLFKLLNKQKKVNVKILPLTVKEAIHEINRLINSS